MAKVNRITIPFEAGRNWVTPTDEWNDETNDQYDLRMCPGGVRYLFKVPRKCSKMYFTISTTPMRDSYKMILRNPHSPYPDVMFYDEWQEKYDYTGMMSTVEASFKILLATSFGLASLHKPFYVKCHYEYFEYVEVT